jgi:hypothetical protein
MYQGMPLTPVPYVLTCDREAKIQTWFWLQSEKAIETKSYSLRLMEAMANESPLQGNFQKKAQVDFDLTTDRLLNIVTKVENYEAEGDKFETPEDIKRIVERLDFLARFELVQAAISRASLDPGIAKNWNSSSSTSNE